MSVYDRLGLCAIVAASLFIATGCSPKSPIKATTSKTSPATAVVANSVPIPVARLDQKHGTVYPGWGKLYDPQNDTKVELREGKLTMIVPPGLHDINPTLGGMKAPRIHQEVEGNFTLEVTVAGQFTPGQNSAKEGVSAFNGAGISLWVKEQTYLRLERNAWWDGRANRYTCYMPLFEIFNDGIQSESHQPIGSTQFFGDTATRLRLKRDNQFLIASYSFDGGNSWMHVPQLASTFPSTLYVGIEAVSTSAEPFTVAFEDFKLTRE